MEQIWFPRAVPTTLSNSTIPGIPEEAFRHQSPCFSCLIFVYVAGKHVHMSKNVLSRQKCRKKLLLTFSILFFLFKGSDQARIQTFGDLLYTSLYLHKLSDLSHFFFLTFSSDLASLNNKCTDMQCSVHFGSTMNE
jgi:hypothetical protein